MNGILWLVIPTSLVVFFALRRIVSSGREAAIRKYRFPSSIKKKIVEEYPEISESQASLVLKALRDYFYISLDARGMMVSQPSKVVDVAWHEFILFTREYHKFCGKAFGKFLHHTPSTAMPNDAGAATRGIRRAWLLACKRARVNPKTPRTMPLLFAIDGMLNIRDGYRYSLDCGASPGSYCVSDIGCGGSSDATSGCSGGSSCSSDSGGADSGGDGGCGGD